MKVVLFNGSPRKNGNTYHCLKIVMNELKKENIECDYVWIGGKRLQGCTACLQCVENDNQKKGMESNETTKLTWPKKNPYLAGFGFIFLMELGDKTQLLTITLASIYAAPFEVWFGAFLGLISVAWIGIFAGGLIAKKVPKFYLKVVAVSIFVIVGILVLISAF